MRERRGLIRGGGSATSLSLWACVSLTTINAYNLPQRLVNEVEYLPRITLLVLIDTNAGEGASVPSEPDGELAELKHATPLKLRELTSSSIVGKLIETC